jgi:hypothetical protein
MNAQTASSAEAARLYQLMVPADEEQRIASDPAAAAAEYAQLYDEHLRFKWRVPGVQARPLSSAQAQRMQLLEDTLSTRILAKQRLVVHNKVEAIMEEAARQKREFERAQEQASPMGTGTMRRIAGYLAGIDEANTPPSTAATCLSFEDQRRVLDVMTDDSKVEAVDLPSRFKFEFVLGKMALDLKDDRWPDEVDRQLLSLALQGVRWKFDLDLDTDHRGRDLAEWRMECCLSTFRALHGGRRHQWHRRLQIQGSSTKWAQQGLWRRSLCWRTGWSHNSTVLQRAACLLLWRSTSSRDLWASYWSSSSPLNRLRT